MFRVRFVHDTDPLPPDLDKHVPILSNEVSGILVAGICVVHGVLRRGSCLTSSRT